VTISYLICLPAILRRSSTDVALVLSPPTNSSCIPPPTLFEPTSSLPTQLISPRAGLRCHSYRAESQSGWEPERTVSSGIIQESPTDSTCVPEPRVPKATR